MADHVDGGRQWADAVIDALSTRGWSRYKLAQEVGVARETCCRWLREGIVPSARHRATVSVVLDDERLRQVETLADGVMLWRG